MLHSKLKKYLEKRNGDFLVTGPPGAGKTLILTQLIEYVIKKRNYDTAGLIVFCFNRRWAKILRDITAEAIGKSINEISITSFFAFCAELIERSRSIEFYNGAIKPDAIKLKILTAPQQWKLLKDLLSERIDRKSYPMAFKYMHANNYVARSFIQEVFDFILRAQENLLSPIQLSVKFTPFFNEILSEITGIFARYKNELIENDVYDYGRLLEEAVSILRENNIVKGFYLNAFDTVIVDELQELNRAQFEITKIIAGNNRIFFGNDDQCTYAFRGSMLNNFNEVYSCLYSSVKQKGTENSNILFLKKNYRNSYMINEISTEFIKQNEMRIPKRAKSVSNNLTGDSFILKEFKNTLEEINYICSHIRKLIMIKGLEPESICIIVKGHDYKTRLLEKMLHDNDIYFLMRSSRSVLANAGVRYILDFLRLINLLKSPGKIDPADEEIIARRMLKSILCSEFIGVNPICLEGIFNSLEAEHLDFRVRGSKENEPVCRVLKKLESAEDPKLQLFIRAVDRYRNIKEEAIFDLIYSLVFDDDIGVMRVTLKDSLCSEYEKEKTATLLGDYINTVKDFSENNPMTVSISSYLDYLEDALDNSFLEEIEESTKEFIKPGFINILSYHQCKGLEFDAVFMPFINENYLPAQFGKNQLYDMQVFNYFLDGKMLREDILRSRHFSDERKLFYNGMTRAARFLSVTSSNLSSKSVFFEELQDIYNKINKKMLKKKKYYVIRGIAGSGTSAEHAVGIRTMMVSNRWLERKKALAKQMRMVSAKADSNEAMLKGLLYLKIMYPYELWWSCRNVTFNENNPYLLSGKKFYYTALNSYAECPFKYKINYFFNIREAAGLGMLLGNIYHEIIKKYFENKDKSLTWESLEEIIFESFSNLKHEDFEFGSLKKQIIQKALSDFRTYYDSFICGFNEDMEIQVERPFSFNLDTDIITGLIDQMVFHNDDRIELIDFKSGTKNSQLLSQDIEIQLRLYRMAIDLCSDFEPLKQKELMLKYIFLGEEKKQGFLLPKDFYDYNDFNLIIRKIISGIKSEDFTAAPRNSFICSSCGIRLLCKNIKGLD